MKTPIILLLGLVLAVGFVSAGVIIGGPGGGGLGGGINPGDYNLTNASCKDGQVLVCHTISQPKLTMCLPEASVYGHLGHGDYLGVCQQAEVSVNAQEQKAILMTWRMMQRLGGSNLRFLWIYNS